MAAYKEAAGMRLTNLAPDLIASFGRVPKPAPDDTSTDSYSAELEDLCEALADLHAIESADTILATLGDPKFQYASLLGDQLQKLQSPRMAEGLQKFLKDHVTWASAKKEEDWRKRDPDLLGRYEIALDALIKYQDLESVPLLLSRRFYLCSSEGG